MFITNVKGTFFGMSESEEASKRGLIEPYERGLHWLLKAQNLITKDLIGFFISSQ